MQITTDNWVPIYDGIKTERVTLADAMWKPTRSIQTGRDDWNFAILLLAIGMRKTGYEPPPLLGDGERFMQRRPSARAKQHPIGSLLLDEPGAHAVKMHSDIFIRRGQRDRMCCNCAAIALYTHTQFAGAAGAGVYPGNLFHSALYLMRGNTLGDTVILNQYREDVSVAAYFSASMQYWLDDPSETGECGMCGERGPLITSYWRGVGGFEYVPNPHQAHTHTGTRLVIDAHHTELDIMDGAAPDSPHTIQPVALREYANVGDWIIGFGTCYDKAALRRMFWREFQMRPSSNRAPISQCVRSVWRMRYPESVAIDHQSTFGGEVAANVAELVLRGQTELNAALAVYDRYCPEPHYSAHTKHHRWKFWRDRICELGDEDV